MLGDNIRTARKRRGMTQEQLAPLIGVEQATLARYERGTVAPSINRLRKIALALAIELEELTDLPDESPPAAAAPVGVRSAAQPGYSTFPLDAQAAPSPIDMERDLPVLGAVLAADLEIPENGDGLKRIERLDLSTSETIDFVRRPAGLRGNRLAYALYVQGASMEPRHEQGDLIYVDTRRPPAAGDDVVVQLRGVEGEDQSVVTAMIKRLCRRTSSFVELEQFNPPLRFRLQVDTIHAIHRVVRLAELLGL